MKRNINFPMRIEFYCVVVANLPLLYEVRNFAASSNGGTKQ